MEKRRNRFLETIKDVRSLPTIPGVILKILSLIDGDETSFKEISKLIASDQSLSVRILRLANSPFYSLKNNVSTIPHAMVMLGSGAIKGLVLTSAVFELIEQSIEGLWEHALGTATAAHVIARRLNISKPEEVSTAALLHDIGKVIIKAKLREGYDNLLIQAKEADISLKEAETALLETDHAEVGEYAMKTWNLQEDLIEPIACHHDVARSNTFQERTAVVHLADILIKASGFGFGGDHFVPPIQEAAYKRLSLTEPLLEEIIETIEEKLIEVKQFSEEIRSAGQF